MSEYQRSYTPFRSRSVSPQRSVPVTAGLRSKQRGVSREPQLPSRKKSVMFRPQMSAIFAPNGVASRRQGARREASPERGHPALDSRAPTSLGRPASTRSQAAEQEASLETPTHPVQPVSPRPRPSEPHGQSQPQTPLTTVHGQQPVANGCSLRWKAGLRSGGDRSKLRRSEYHRQFTWKTAKHAGSPLLNAQQALYSSSRVVPPFKKHPVAMETEYRRSFRCQTPPPRGRRPPKHLERKRREAPEVKPHPQQEQEAPPQKTTDENRMSKTEYLSNYRSPVLTEDNQLVQELREKALSYRRRAWGTHFSRNHLNQLLSEYNSLWEASETLTDAHSTDTLTDTHSTDTLTDAHSTAPTTDTRTSEHGSNAVDEAEDDDDVDDEDVRTISSSRSVQPLDLTRASSSSSVSSKSGSADKSHTDKNTHAAKQTQHTHTDKTVQHTCSDKHTHGNTAMCPGAPVSRRLAWGEAEPTDEKEGRLPTPPLKVRPVRRTHHDRTTPATGGAILVSPPKQLGATDPPLGKPQSPYKHMGLQTGVAAGMATVDPLPLREEGAWLETSPTPKPSTRSTPNQRKSSSKPVRMKQGPSVPPPHPIQGTLRDPEFQHNGQLGCKIPGAGCGSDEDDRFSVLSWRSAASCSEASAVLERTQRRRDKFWGKK